MLYCPGCAKVRDARRRVERARMSAKRRRRVAARLPYQVEATKVGTRSVDSPIRIDSVLAHTVVSLDGRALSLT